MQLKDLPSAALPHVQLGSLCLPGRGRAPRREVGVKVACPAFLSSCERSRPLPCPLRPGAPQDLMFGLCLQSCRCCHSTVLPAPLALPLQPY